MKKQILVSVLGLMGTVVALASGANASVPNCKSAAIKAALSQFQKDFPGRRNGGTQAKAQDPGQYQVTVLQQSDEGDEIYEVDTTVKNGKCLVSAPDHIDN